MKQIGKMLCGEGEKEYQAEHQEFRDYIPDEYPAGLTIAERAELHPAYNGPGAWTLQGFDYRRAHYMHGPQSKQEHAEFARQQAQTEPRTDREMQIASWLLGEA